MGDPVEAARLHPSWEGVPAPLREAILAHRRILRERGEHAETAAMAAALAAADRAAWSTDMKARPKDGTEFDGWISTGRVENVSWDASWGDDDGAFLRRIDGDGCVMWVEVDEPMAAWRPLPLPPVPGDE